MTNADKTSANLKLIILDRDGVINFDSDAYIKSPEEFIPIPGSLEAIRSLRDAGYAVAVATNQSGIARGLYSKEMYDEITAKMTRLLTEAGTKLDLLVYCPHGPEDDCDCRKPRPGLYERIGRELGVSLHGVPVVGDSLRDLQAARSVGARPILVRTGKGERTLAAGKDLEDTPVFDNLAAVVRALLAGDL